MTDVLKFDSSKAIENSFGGGFALKGISPKPRSDYQKQEVVFAGKSIESTPGTLMDEFLSRNSISVSTTSLQSDGNPIKFDPKNMPIVQAEDLANAVPPCLIRSKEELENFILATSHARVYARVNTPSGPILVPFELRKQNNDKSTNDAPVLEVPSDKPFTQVTKADKISSIIDAFSGSTNISGVGDLNPFRNWADKLGRAFTNEPIVLKDTQARKHLNTTDFKFSVGDEILEIDGRKMASSDEIRKALEDKKNVLLPVKIKVKRADSEKIEEITIN